MPDFEDLVALAAALACGIALGAEREARYHPAGIRTLTLISFGACLLTQAGRWLAEQSAGPSGIQVDPGRLASYVIAGIGFLGAGPIISRGSTIEGLTTAATIWMAAAVGVVAGVGSPGMAMGATLVAMIALQGLLPLGDWLVGGRRGPYHLTLRIRDSLTLQRVDHLLTMAGFVRNREVRPMSGGWIVRFSYAATADHCRALLTELAGLDLEVVDEAETAQATETSSV